MLRAAPQGVRQTSVTTASGNDAFTLQSFNLESMTFTLSGNFTGTSCDVYIQTLGPDGNYYDMGHFNQVTGNLATPQYMSISPIKNAFSASPGDATLAAGTVSAVSFMGTGMRIKWVNVAATVSTLVVNAYATTVNGNGA